MTPGRVADAALELATGNYLPFLHYVISDKMPPDINPRWLYWLPTADATSAGLRLPASGHHVILDNRAGIDDIGYVLDAAQAARALSVTILTPKYKTAVIADDSGIHQDSYPLVLQRMRNRRAAAARADVAYERLCDAVEHDQWLAA